MRRLVLVGGVLVILLAMAFGAFLQFSTSRALDHAEAFRFRRMIVSQQAEQDTYRFFFVTNRQEEVGEGDLVERFGNERGSASVFGLFDTSIEPSLGIGMLVNPTDWFRDEEIQLLDVRTLERQGFLEELRRQVEASPGRTLLVNVNGFRERFPSALRKTAFLAHVLDVDSPVLVFDWPGDQGSSIRGYRRAQRLARESGEALAATLDLIIREIRPDGLWLVANSMGGEVVVSAFTLMKQQPHLGDAETEIDHVVLTAPDVGNAEFGRQFRDEITALSDDLTVYVSSNDRALLMSRVLNRERRLGESTLDPRHPDPLPAASLAWELVEPGSERVSMIDVTPINRTRNFHNFSLETPEFFDDLYLRLTSDDMPHTRLKYPVRTPDGTQYWVLTRGRE